jgi:hypothetical protein
MYLILVGYSLREMPEPIGEAPDWLVDFRGSFGPVPGALGTEDVSVDLVTFQQRASVVEPEGVRRQADLLAGGRIDNQARPHVSHRQSYAFASGSTCIVRAW